MLEAEAYLRAEIGLRVDDTFVTTQTHTLSRDIPLADGTTTNIVIKVTAQDRVSSMNYVVNIARAAADNTNVDLYKFVLHAVPTDTMEYELPSEQFNFDKDTTDYAIIVDDNVAEIRLDALASDGGATLSYTEDGTAVNRTRFQLVLTVQKIIVVTVTNAGNSKTYTLRITRENSRDTRLATLTTSVGMLSPPFDFDTQTDEYYVELSNPVPETVITAQTNHAHATLTIEVDGQAPTDSPTTIEVDAGEIKTAIISVLAQNRETTAVYAVKIARATDATLAELNLSDVTLNQPFDKSVKEYIGKMATEIEHTVLTIRASIADATMRITSSEQGTIRDTVPLSSVEKTTETITLNTKANTVITIEVAVSDQTADGTTRNTYTVTIRPAAIRIRSKVFLEGPLE